MEEMGGFNVVAGFSPRSGFCILMPYEPRYHRMAPMGFKAADHLVTEGHFPGSYVERHRPRPLRARCQRDRQHRGLQQ